VNNTYERHLWVQLSNLKQILWFWFASWTFVEAFPEIQLKEEMTPVVGPKKYWVQPDGAKLPMSLQEIWVIWKFARNFRHLGSISPTFFEQLLRRYFGAKKVLTLNLSTKIFVRNIRTKKARV
jgi:hypothetical protein